MSKIKGAIGSRGSRVKVVGSNGGGEKSWHHKRNGEAVMRDVATAAAAAAADTALIHNSFFVVRPQHIRAISVRCKNAKPVINARASPHFSEEKKALPIVRGLFAETH